MGYLVIIEDEVEAKSKKTGAASPPKPVFASGKIQQNQEQKQQNHCLKCGGCGDNDLEEYHLPVFTIFVSLIQITVFIFMCCQYDGAQLVESRLIYCPLQKYEIWRFVSYMLMHSSFIHLIFNIFVQNAVGIPLEIVHGPLRIAAIYIAGILAGSLSVSVFAPNVCLVGASSGIYALFASHLSHVLLNYKHLEFVALRVVGVFLIAIVGNVGLDLGLNANTNGSDNLNPWSWFLHASASSSPSSETRLPVSELAHFAGAFAGLTMGLVVLKNCDDTDTDTFYRLLLRWFAFGLNGGFLMTLVLFTCQ